MDRELTSSERRAGRFKRAAPIAGIALAAIALVASLPSLLTPRVSLASVRTATVDRGPVAVVVEAMGTVQPASERVVASPVESRLVSVLRRPGDRVEAGDRLAEIDDAAVRAELARLEDRAATLQLERTQAALALERELQDLRQRGDSRGLERDVAQSKLARWERLRADGLASEEQMEERRLELRRADIDVAGLSSSLASAQRSGGARLAGLDLAVQQAQRERDEQARLLELTAARAEEPGVVTWVLDDAGASVARGTPLARVARLDSYRVEARASDVQASRLAEGLPVRVRAPGFDIAGTIAAVSPSVEGGVMTFDVALEEPSHPGLRPNLRVDAWVTVEEKQDALRLERPAGAAGRSRASLFVVDGALARRRDVAIGMAGPDRVEIVEGLQEGDEVIVSDTGTWKGAERLRLRGTR
jgi:HlyD family secretion protein